MSGLSTKNVKTGGEGGLPKTIQPGNIVAKLHGIKLDQPHFMQEENGYFVILEIEGPKPADDFEGFFIDKDDESKGRYEGQVGRVKSIRWAYKDGTTKGGTAISRDNEIMKFVKNLCEALGCMEWWDAADEKHPTIESFVEAFSNDKAWGDTQLNLCVCGREYYNNEGYINYDLYLPKFSKTGVPFEAVGTENSRLIEFNENDHIEKAQPKEVDNFEGGEESAPEEGAATLPEGDASAASPEFEL